MVQDIYQFQTTTIRKIIRESPDAVSVQVDLPNEYSFVPGQYAIVRITINGSEFVRQYSFSSAPSSGELWFTIVNTKQGTVSNWFTSQAIVGDRIEISKPFSGPLAQKLPRGEICMIAGGSGIVPLMNILRENRLSPKPKKIRLLYTTKSRQQCFTKELSFKHEYELIHLHISDKQRLPQNEIIDFIARCNTIYLCGSRQFTDDMSKICQQHNSKVKLVTESFTLKP